MEMYGDFSEQTAHSARNTDIFDSIYLIATSLEALWSVRPLRYATTTLPQAAQNPFQVITSSPLIQNDCSPSQTSSLQSQ
jgi:hypothetical protein